MASMISYTFFSAIDDKTRRRLLYNKVECIKASKYFSINESNSNVDNINIDDVTQKQRSNF